VKIKCVFFLHFVVVVVMKHGLSPPQKRKASQESRNRYE